MNTMIGPDPLITASLSRERSKVLSRILVRFPALKYVTQTMAGELNAGKMRVRIEELEANSLTPISAILAMRTEILACAIEVATMGYPSIAKQFIELEGRCMALLLSKHRP